MAHLLGSEYCIESLRSDVGDLQAAIMDVFSRAGPVNFPSWKYPDKMSSEVDMKELLEIYDYSDDEEERQVAHIVLLELVVDRLVLLLQAMAKYVDQILTASKGGVQTHTQQITNTSIGLVVRKYWNKMVQVHTAVQQIQSENKTKSRRASDLENTVTKLGEELKKANIDGAGTLPTALTLNGGLCLDSRLMGTLSKASTISISKDDYSKSTQTYETAFVPCEACERVQRNLRDVGSSVITICQTQSLPSSLSKYKTQVEKLEWLSANDIARWTTEQNKDLARVNKHLEQLMSTIEPLRNDLAAEQRKVKDLQVKYDDVTKEVKLERETQSTQQRQYEGKLKQVREEKTEAVDKVKRQNEGLERVRQKLEEQLEQMKGQLQTQKDMVVELELAKSKLTADMEDRIANSSRVKTLESDIDDMSRELDDVSSKLEGATKELNREKAKSKSVNKHTESVKSKQDTLVSRLDELDQENEQLRSQVAELEDIKESLEETLERAEEEKNRLKDDLKVEKELTKEISEEKESLEQVIKELEGNIQRMEKEVKEVKEHERLMVEYPDLNGPVNPDFSGTGDIVTDMENQVKANSVRIQLLEEQNNGLRKTVTKMLQTQAQQQMPLKPMPLWDPDGSRVTVQQDQHRGWNGNEEASYTQAYTVDSNSRQAQVPPLFDSQGHASPESDESDMRYKPVALPPSGTKKKKVPTASLR